MKVTLSDDLGPASDYVHITLQDGGEKKIDALVHEDLIEDLGDELLAGVVDA
jgi:hypothetical protein